MMLDGSSLVASFPRQSFGQVPESLDPRRRMRERRPPRDDRSPPPWPRPAPSSQWQGGCRSLCQLTRVSRAGAAATRFPQPNVEHVKKQHTTRLRGHQQCSQKHRPRLPLLSVDTRASVDARTHAHGSRQRALLASICASKLEGRQLHSSGALLIIIRNFLYTHNARSTCSSPRCACGIICNDPAITVVFAARSSEVGPQGRAREVSLHESRARATQKLGHCSWGKFDHHTSCRNSAAHLEDGAPHRDRRVPATRMMKPGL